MDDHRPVETGGYPADALLMASISPDDDRHGSSWLLPEDAFDLIEGLVGEPETAIDGMRDAYVTAFTGTAGPGSAALAERAWRTWRGTLLHGEGVAVADARAGEVVQALRRHGTPVWARLWLSSSALTSAVRCASQRAADVA